MYLFDRGFYEKFNRAFIRLGYLSERSLFSRLFMLFEEKFWREIKRLIIQSRGLTTESWLNLDQSLFAYKKRKTFAKF